jgi:hypothetical protein
MSYVLSGTREPVRDNKAFNGQRVAAAAARLGHTLDPKQFGAGALLNSKGELNASSQRDLMRLLGTLALASSTGEVVQEEALITPDHAAAIASAVADKTGQEWLTLGEIVGTQVVETMGRAGFTRRILQFNPVAKGDIAKVRVRVRDVVAVTSTTDPNTPAAQVRQNVVFPQWFDIICNILIEDAEINQDSGDLLDDRYNDGLEQMMVVEDRAFINAANKAASIYNPLFVFPTLTPSTWQAMKIQLESYANTPVANAVMSYDLWNDVTTDPEFVSWFSEIEKHEISFEGNLGKIAGVEIITDGFRHQKLQVLQPGQLYFFAAPQVTGVVSQLGELFVRSIDRYSQNEPKRGWYFFQQEALALPNAHAIVRGQRS